MLIFPHILGLIVLTTELSSTTSQKRSEQNCLLKGKLEVYIFIVLIVTSVVYNAVVDIYNFAEGIRIYRKTLREASRGRSSGVQARVHIRSRQQRVSTALVYTSYTNNNVIIIAMYKFLCLTPTYV